MTSIRLIEKWQRAKKDLGIEFVAPYELEIHPGVRIRADLWVPQFGGKEGTLVVTEYSGIEPHLSRIRELGYGFSVLEEPSRPESYDRATFIDMLSDWGWTGQPEKKPGWVREMDGRPTSNTMG